MAKKIILFKLCFLFLYTFSYADSLFFKNGRKIEGLICKETEKTLEIEVCLGGRVEYSRSEIVKIERSSPEEALAIRRRWQQERQELERRQIAQKAAEQERQELEKQQPTPKPAGQEQPKVIEFSQDQKAIELNVRLNNKVDVLLTLDTGASAVVLKKAVAQKLGIDLSSIKEEAKLILADGRSIPAKYVLLKTVKVQDAEAKDVEAAVMLDEAKEASFKDGLLGMSFLRHFNFKVDNRNKKLTLEKL